VHGKGRFIGFIGATEHGAPEPQIRIKK